MESKDDSNQISSPGPSPHIKHEIVDDFGTPHLDAHYHEGDTKTMETNLGQHFIKEEPVETHICDHVKEESLYPPIPQDVKAFVKVDNSLHSTGHIQHNISTSASFNKKEHSMCPAKSGEYTENIDIDNQNPLRTKSLTKQLSIGQIDDDPILPENLEQKLVIMAGDFERIQTPGQQNSSKITASSTSHLKSHNIAHSVERPYQSDICQKSFDQEGCLKSHQKSVHGHQKPYQCQKSFSIKGTLDVHYRGVHKKEKPYQCDICQKSFSIKGTLDVHYRGVHKKEKPYQCDICQKYFFTSTVLKRHKIIHSGEKNYKCEICQTLFTQKVHLMSHQKGMHEHKKPYPCDICQKSFSTKWYLNVHLDTHQKEKLYPCDICRKQFQTSVTLKCHRIIHTADNPYQCDICQKIFSTKGTLDVHCRGVHKKEKPYQCDICMKQFVTSSRLKRHKFTHSTEKPHKCDICHRTFTQKCNLNVHQLSIHKHDKS